MIKMSLINILVPLTILALLAYSSPSLSQNDDTYVQDACNVTQYRDICIRSLSPFSNTAKRNPTAWARAGVSVTVTEAKSVANYFFKVRKRNSTQGIYKVALMDCIECIQDTVDNLYKSLRVLRKLDGQSQTFDSQMADVTAWLSAALTDEDTCLDGFGDGQQGRQIELLQIRVTNVTYVTSNALALVNKLATTGGSAPKNY